MGAWGTIEELRGERYLLLGCSISGNLGGLGRPVPKVEGTLRVSFEGGDAVGC